MVQHEEQLSDNSNDLSLMYTWKRQMWYVMSLIYNSSTPVGLLQVETGELAKSSWTQGNAEISLKNELEGENQPLKNCPQVFPYVP